MAAQAVKPELMITAFTDVAVMRYIERLKEITEHFGPNQPIILHISSYGGSVYGLTLLYEFLKTLSNPIVTYTSSKAMSAGAILLAAGGSPGMRFASPNSSIMIHEVQGGLWPDDIKNQEDNMEVLKKDNERWMTILAKSMGLKNAKDIRALIKERSIGHDLSLTAKEALDLKVIDRVCYVRLEQVYGFNIHTTADLSEPTPVKKTSKRK